MPYTPADARFLLARAAGLAHRTLLSLRTRGLGPTWERVRAQLKPSVPAMREGLYLPPATPFAPFALATSDAPVASIVIPVYGQFTHTLACLRALAAHPPAAAFEVIVVDDGSIDDCATTSARRMAASSPPATMAPHSRAVNSWSC